MSRVGAAWWQIRDAIKQDMENLHLDMLRQFHLQQIETRKIMQVCILLLRARPPRMMQVPAAQRMRQARARG